MSESAHPFIDNGNGFPTSDSVREALGMFSIERLADVPVSFRGQEGSMIDLITHCPIEHLTQNWPKGFITQVIGSATQAAQATPEA